MEVYTERAVSGVRHSKRDTCQSGRSSPAKIRSPRSDSSSAPTSVRIQSCSADEKSSNSSCHVVSSSIRMSMGDAEAGVGVGGTVGVGVGARVGVDVDVDDVAPPQANIETATTSAASTPSQLPYLHMPFFMLKSFSIAFIRYHHTVHCSDAATPPFCTSLHGHTPFDTIFPPDLECGHRQRRRGAGNREE